MKNKQRQKQKQVLRLGFAIAQDDNVFGWVIS
jgi:hypothetical protein